jgi:Fur family transcriptional regulator, ferric uptake regulator
MEEVDFSKFKQLLRKNGFFVTKARLRLYGFLYHHPASTIKELIALAKANDQATIYRNIELFEQLGVITRLRLGWHTKIELTDKFQKHHHHITCIKCGEVKTTPDNQQLEAIIHKMSSELIYEMVEHHVEIRGICKACNVLTKH